MKRGLSLAAVVAAGLGGACGGGMTSIRLFTTEWTDDSGASMGELQQKLAAVRPQAGADVAVGVGGEADEMIGQPLDGGARWTFKHPLDTRPIVTGRVVVASGGGELFALDAQTGRQLWARATGGLALHGAGDDGTVTVITMTGAVGSGSTLLSVLHDGSVQRQVETDKVLGAPAVLGGYAFVPWGGVYVSAIDLQDGDEQARVVVREKTSRAWAQGGALYFGEIGAFRFDEHIKDASKNQATHVALPVRELPGSPRWMEPGTENPGPAAEARDRIRIYARPSGEGSALAVDAGRFYATYFRMVMGFDAKDGALRWVHMHGSDVIGGAAGAGSVVLCDEQGRVTTLDAATGGQKAQVDLGAPLKGCAVQVDGLRGAGEPAAVPPLAEQLSAALLDDDQELATAKRLLLRELAALEDATATKTLVALASDERTSPLVLPDARVALASRRNGAEFMLAALRSHYDFLRDVLREPPVGPMAQALAAMNEGRAAPLLADHLLDPADADDDVRQAAVALVKLATPAEAAKVGQFFGMYRATAPSEEIEQAVVAAGETLVRVGGKEGVARVVEAMGDPMTLEGVRQRLKEVVKVPAEEKAAPKETGKKGKRGR